jgi:predicted enzyme related to lactoylglutathione lyase
VATQSAPEPVRCAAASSYTDKRTALSGANQRLPLDVRVKADLRSLAMIKQIKFVSIPVADQNRALDFYTEKLGFTIITDQPFDEKQRWIELRVPKAETRVVLFTTEGDEKRIGSMMPMSYACDDIDKTYEELKGRGVEFEGPPQKQPWGKYAMFKDSEGNRFVLSAD